MNAAVTAADVREPAGARAAAYGGHPCERTAHRATVLNPVQHGDAVIAPPYPYGGCATAS
ncbi:hypothetical protein [Streptomyces lavendofoliae]|uniref:Uncharacterized protein n=1 Tax=Streptomyces lavendofoliae TaxID=67314 RepID=A0A918HY00_9ACTN|nr:hypothetical protein [Streptomyces lavendofoliae]GGU38043.1 hypothetical protein GCM10010274_26670 [Streptomyces lavendofoliae]